MSEGRSEGRGSQNGIEAEKGNQRAHLPSNNAPWHLSSPFAPCAQHINKRRYSENEQRRCIGHGYWHIPLSARQLAGRAQVRDVQLLGNVVRVDHQVIGIAAIAVLVCARLLSSLFFLELSAFCTREFRFLCHRRQAFPLPFLFFFFLLLLFLVFVGIIALGAT